MDPQSRPGEFSPAGGGRRPVEIRLGLGRLARSSPAGCTFSGAECHDRFGGGQEPDGKVTRGVFGRPESVQAVEVDTSPDRGRLPRPPASGRPGAFDLGLTARSGLRPRAWHGLVSPGPPRVSGESVGNPPDPS